MYYEVLQENVYVEKPFNEAKKKILSWTGVGAYPSYLTDGELLGWGVFSIFSQHIEP